MTATSERIAAAVQADRHCPLSTDGTGEHCDCWFNDPCSGRWAEAGVGECCYCDGMPYCQRIDYDGDGGTDPSHAAEWDVVDEDRTVVAW